MIDFENKTVVVLGAARQGLGLAKYAARHGANVIVTDGKAFEQLSAAREELKDFDVEWVNPILMVKDYDQKDFSVSSDLSSSSFILNLTLISFVSFDSFLSGVEFDSLLFI